MSEITSLFARWAELEPLTCRAIVFPFTWEIAIGNRAELITVGSVRSGEEWLDKLPIADAGLLLKLLLEISTGHGLQTSLNKSIYGWSAQICDRAFTPIGSATVYWSHIEPELAVLGAYLCWAVKSPQKVAIGPSWKY